METVLVDKIETVHHQMTTHHLSSPLRENVSTWYGPHNIKFNSPYNDFCVLISEESEWNEQSDYI